VVRLLKASLPLLKAEAAFPKADPPARTDDQVIHDWTIQEIAGLDDRASHEQILGRGVTDRGWVVG
jgi:hypothetical protein